MMLTDEHERRGSKLEEKSGRHGRTPHSPTGRYECVPSRHGSKMVSDALIVEQSCDSQLFDWLCHS